MSWFEVCLSNTKSAGRLALGLYLIPGYPSWSYSQAAVEIAIENGVDFIEFPVIGTGCFTRRTGSTIANALETVEAELSEPSQPLIKWLDTIPIGVGVVYDGAWPRPEKWEADDIFLSHASALLMEADVEHVDVFSSVAAGWYKPLIATVDATAQALPVEKAELIEQSRGFIYMSLGDQTGRRSAGEQQMRRTIEQIREINTQSLVFAAFGLQDRLDIEEVRRSGCDGAIIGSAAIEVLQQGVRPFHRWLTSILEACREGS